jgi:hypothetical protein
MPKPDQPEPKAKRLTLSEIVQAQLTALSRGTPEHSSVRLTRNARGDTQVEVTVRAAEDGADTAERAAERCRTIYDGLCDAYPMREQPSPEAT